MITNTREEIFVYISKNNPIAIRDIQKKFGISKEMIHRHVKRLVNENRIYKIWTPPLVYYFARDTINIPVLWGVWTGNNEIIEENFVYFWADWVLEYWNKWFTSWCKKRSLNVETESSIYLKTLNKYSQFKDIHWFIDGKVKMMNTFDEVFLDDIYYLDFYSIEKYWKTLLGNLMLYWKQTWEKKLADSIIHRIEPYIHRLIRVKKIDWFAFIPPSIDRKVQLMTLINQWLHLDLKELKPIKLFKDTPVPQKSLNKIEDRIINARDTIYIVDRDFICDTILIIDDAVWSWATLNETAKKIKNLWLAKTVIGLSIVWSYKWFEVINEV